MANHESAGKTDEWYTPEWVFSAMCHQFDLDPCNGSGTNPASRWCSHRYFGAGLDVSWPKMASIWLNPPFGGRNGIRPWLEKLVEHGNGIAIVPNRTATDWWQMAADEASLCLFVKGKIKFLRHDFSEGKSPGYGNVLLAYGSQMAKVLEKSDIAGIRLSKRGLWQRIRGF